MIFVAVLVVGLALGFLVGRWWIVLAPVAFGVWVASASDVNEIPPWALGLAYAVAGVVGTAVGVMIRRRRASAVTAP